MAILFDIVAVVSLGLSIFNTVRKSKTFGSAPAADVAPTEHKHEWSGHTREVNHKLFRRGK